MINGVPSSVKLQMKTIVPPANNPGVINGKVILKNFRNPLHPRFAAASSIAGSTLAIAAEALRYMIG